MRNLFPIMFLTLFSLLTYSQQSCLDTTTSLFKYQAKINIQNLPSNFNKADFLSLVTGLDNLSNENYQILDNSITLLKKTIPSWNENKIISIYSNSDINYILNNLTNSIEYKHCIITNCSDEDDSYNYYALLNQNFVSNDFNKNDFVNYILSIDNVSQSVLDLLNFEITSVSKAFPSAFSQILNRVVVVNSNVNLYEVFENNLLNSVDHHECILFCNDVNNCLLGEPLRIENIEHKRLISVYPNPTYDYLFIKSLESPMQFNVTLSNNLGQIVKTYKNFSGSTNNINLGDLKSGIYFLKITEFNEIKPSEFFKIIKK